MCGEENENVNKSSLPVCLNTHIEQIAEPRPSWGFRLEILSDFPAGLGDWPGEKLLLAEDLRGGGGLPHRHRSPGYLRSQV